ncbi:unnamed protein product [Ectocarpus sp. CCAP 1310/34]|nr:unnamed protein product [Ectocarpus sp. CCAP 1310/34]
MNNQSSPLFERITLCSNAILACKENRKHDSSYEEVMQHLPHTVTGKDNTDLIKASQEYLKLGFVDRDTPIRKVNIALWVAVSLANDHDNNKFAQEVCERFQGLYDYDRNVMEKIISFSMYNDRIGKLLDKVMIRQESNTTPAFDLEFNAEFVLIFFNIMECLVKDKHRLTDLGYAANVTPDDMEKAREIIHKHLDDIAMKCSPCFKKKELKPPARRELFPATGVLPHPSIGCNHVTYDEVIDKLKEGFLDNAEKEDDEAEVEAKAAAAAEAKAKKVTIDKLRESLLDKPEKGEFLEMIFAAISHASNKDEPVVTYHVLTLDSAKDFFLEKILDKAQAEETRQAILASDEARELRQKNKSLEEENSFLKQQLLEEMEMASLVEQQREHQEEKYRKLCKENPILKQENEELTQKLERATISIAFNEKNEKHFRKEIASLTKLKRKRTTKEKNDEAYDRFRRVQEEKVWSGDELDE